MSEATASVVLCGGRSSRMGQAKAWLPLGPETMLQRVVRTLQLVTPAVFVLAAPGQALPSLPESVMMFTDEAEYAGPLAALLTAWQKLPAHVQRIYFSACDMPLLNVPFVEQLLRLAQRSNATITAPNLGGQLQPLAAVYQRDCLSAVKTILDSGGRSLRELVDRVPTTVVTAADFTSELDLAECLMNINTPAEYAAALQKIVPTADTQVGHRARICKLSECD